MCIKTYIPSPKRYGALLGEVLNFFDAKEQKKLKCYF